MLLGKPTTKRRRLDRVLLGEQTTRRQRLDKMLLERKQMEDID